MRRIQEIGKVLLVVTGLLVLTGNANVHCSPPVVQESQQGNTNQPDENETYIQSFDVVSQNGQLQFNTLFLYDNQIAETEEINVILVNTNFKIASTKFFEILFEQIISPNAP